MIQGKHLNVEMDFHANTQQAQQSIQQLQNTLSQLSNMPIGANVDINKFKQASAAAQELQIHLKNAYNASTGNIDLSLLNKSLSTTNSNLATLGNSLLSAGDTGKQAFIQLAQSISQADAPLLKTNSLLTSMWTTLKNTARWSISQSVLRGFTGAIQTAYGYAKDLNESLTNIRIVTGQSTEQMAKFAEQANKAAKSLSTTTTAYTDAALIYYQQGLSDQEVKARTDVTMKMANTQGKSAEEVSDQLTSIWNNFAKGSENLEYYADAIQKLGATTASSSDEIIEGVQKFASVTGTIGLSFEYATAALATITATTRESADVVGTALKTLFSRMEGLKQDGVLDDGTDLNKYSTALANVGVNIKDTTGDLKDMDTILDETASKWENLSDAQKMALAQTVAGVRQYTQFITLMNNWDFFQENVATAKGASGYLNEQQEIYAEGWEAAAKRIKASLESIYQDLLDDKFFISFNNGLAKTLSGIDDFIKKFGGIGPLLLTIGGILATVFANKLPGVLQTLSYNFTLLFKGANAATEQVNSQFKVMVETALKTNKIIDDTGNKQNKWRESEKQALTNALALKKVKEDYLKVESKLTTQEQLHAQTQIADLEKEQQAVVDLWKDYEQLENKLKNINSLDTNTTATNRIESLKRTSMNEADEQGRFNESEAIQRNANTAIEQNAKSTDILIQKYIELRKARADLYNDNNKLFTEGELYKDQIQSLSKIREQLEANGKAVNNTGFSLSRLSKIVRMYATTASQAADNSEDIVTILEVMDEEARSNNLNGVISAFDTLLEYMREAGISTDQLEQGIKNIETPQAFAKLDKDLQQMIKDEDEANNKTKNLDSTLSKLSFQHVATGLENLVLVSGQLTTLVMGINSFYSAYKTLADPDITGWEKWSSVIMSTSMGLSMMSGVIKGNLLPNLVALILGVQAETYEEEKGIKAKIAKILLTKAETLETKHSIIATNLKAAAQALLNGEIGKTLLLLLPYTAALIAVVAAVAGLIAIYKKWKESQPEEQLKKLTEEAEESAKAAEEATQKYKELKETIESYNSAIDKLKYLTEGTNEFKEAIKEANEEAKKLIDDYDMTGHVSLDKNGLLKIDEDYLKELEAGSLNEAQIKNTDALIKRQAQIEAQDTIDNNKLIQNNLNQILGSNWAKQVNSENYAQIKSILQDTTKDNKTMAREIIATLTNKNVNSTQLDDTAISMLSNSLGKADDTILSSISTIDTALADNDLQLQENTAAILAATNILSGQDWYDDSNYKNALAAIYGQKVKDYSSDDSDIVKEIKGMTENELKSKYGLSDKSYNEEDKTYTYTKLDGTKIVVDDVDGLKDWAIAKEASEQAMNEMDKFAHSLESLPDYVAKTIDAHYSGDWSNVSLEDRRNTWDFWNNQSDPTIWRQFGIKDEELLNDFATHTGFEELEQKFLNDIDSSEYDEETKTKLKEQLENAKNWYESLPEDNRKLSMQIDFAKGDWDKQLDELRKKSEKQQGIEAATDAGFDAKVYEQYLEMLRKTNEALGKTEKQLNELALAEMKAARGAEEFGKNWESWNNAMTNGTLLEQAEALKDIVPVFKDIFNLSDEHFQLLPDDFIQQNWKQLDKALHGSEKDFAALGNEIGNIIQKNLIKETEKNGKAMVDQLRNDLEESINQGAEELQNNLNIVNDFHDALDSLNNLDIETQVKVTGTTEFLDQCNAMVKAAGWSATQAQEYFKSMGYDVELETTTVPEHPETEKIQWAELDVEKTELAGTPQFKEPPKEIELVHMIPEHEGFAIKAITPTGSFGGNIKNIQKTFNSNKKDSGGGGGSSKGENKKEPKKATDEIERYHMITRTIDRLTRALDKVSKAKDRAFGKERLRLIDEEIKATEKLVDAQKTYLYQIEGHLKEDQAAIAGYGFTFDEYGEITNYIDVYQKQIAKFNSQLTDEAEEAYNEFKEATAQYEETLTLLDEQQAQLQEYVNQIIDLRLEKITTEVEVKIRVNDIEITKLEYLLKKIEHYGESASEKIGILGQKMEQIMAKAGPIQEAIDKIYMEARQYGYGLTEAEVNEIQSIIKAAEDENRKLTQIERERIEAIYAIAEAEDRMLNDEQEKQVQEYKEQLLELNEQMWEIQETIDNTLIETIDDLNGKIQENISRFSSYENMFNHLKNVLELTGKSNTKEGLGALNRLAASTLANATEALKANVMNYEEFQHMRERAAEELQKAQDINDAALTRYWTKQLEEITKKMEESHENMLSSWGDALEAAGDLFDTKINSMIAKLKKDLGDLDTIVDIYNRAKELEDLYLSNNQSIYELSKLARSIGKDIDDTSNLVAKTKLKSLLEDINKLRADGVRLSQYDLEYWQAKYEVEKAEIALQEAQQAKSSINLVRNDEGAWGYVYTANEENIANAQQDYEDKMYAFQEKNASYINQYSERILANRQEMLDALADVDKTRNDYDEEVARIREEYLTKEQFYVDELTKAYERSGLTYKDTILGMVSNDDTLLESHENFTEATIKLIEEELIPAHEEWLTNIDEICEEAGTDLENLTQDTLGYIDEIDESSEELAEDIVTQHEEMRDEIEKTIQAIIDFKNNYDARVAEMEAINEQYYDKTLLDFTNTMDRTVATTKAALDAIVDAARAAAAAIASLATESVGGGNLVSSTTPGVTIKKVNDNSYDVIGVKKDGRTITWNTGTEDGNGKGSPLNRARDLADNIIDYSGSDYGYTDDQIKNGDRSKLVNGWKVASGATGMYTGDWGPEGKLAILHEKELVLNKTDTANILSAVDVIRNLTDKLNVQTLWSKLAKPLSAFSFGIKDINRDLQQQVSIEATFPGVTDHNEIELALNNLVNTASQYASRY